MRVPLSDMTRRRVGIGQDNGRSRRSDRFMADFPGRPERQEIVCRCRLGGDVGMSRIVKGGGELVVILQIYALCLTGKL